MANATIKKPKANPKSATSAVKHWKSQQEFWFTITYSLLTIGVSCWFSENPKNSSSSLGYLQGDLEQQLSRLRHHAATPQRPVAGEGPRTTTAAAAVAPIPPTAPATSVLLKPAAVKTYYENRRCGRSKWSVN